MKKNGRISRGQKGLFSSLPPSALSLSTFLGIEGGATRTTMALTDVQGQKLALVEGGPCNLQLLSDCEILALWKGLFQKIRQQTSHSALRASPSAIGAFLAGCRTPADKKRILKLLKILWPHSHFSVGDDAESALAAALGREDGVVLICGTGSIVRARKKRKTARVGGWGHVAGDTGSGFWMGRELLRSIFQNFDQTDRPSPAARQVIKFLRLKTMEELAQWSVKASKKEIASLTKVLFKHIEEPAARRIIHQAADLLANEVKWAAIKVGLRRPRIAINRGIAMRQFSFRRLLSRAIRKKIPGAQVFLSETEGAVGAALLAQNSNVSQNKKTLQPFRTGPPFF